MINIYFIIIEYNFWCNLMIFCYADFTLYLIKLINIIRKWILKKFKKQKLIIKKKLVNTYLRIYISVDL
jgi:hypothetical protein